MNIAAQWHFGATVVFERKLDAQVAIRRYKNRLISRCQNPHEPGFWLEEVVSTPDAPTKALVPLERVPRGFLLGQQDLDRLWSHRDYRQRGKAARRSLDMYLRCELEELAREKWGLDEGIFAAVKAAYVAEAPCPFFPQHAMCAFLRSIDEDANTVSLTVECSNTRRNNSRGSPIRGSRLCMT